MDPSEIDFLVTQYGQPLYGFCRKLTFDVYDAEDLYQDTFLKAVELSKKIDKNQNPQAWLFALAVSLWQNKKRKYARRKRIAPVVSITEEMSQLLAAEENLEDTVIEKELADLVNVVVAQLDDNLRIPILLFYNAQMSVGEIALILQCPQGTVKSRLYKARQTIKKELCAITEVNADE